MVTLSPEHRIAVSTTVSERWNEQSDTLDSETIYRFVLDGVDYGSKVLDGAVRQQFLRDLFSINRMRSERRASNEVARAAETLGRAMYSLLLPEKLRHEFFERVFESILTFETTEHDLPWELLHDGTAFLSLRHAIGREIPSDRAHGAIERKKAIHVCLIGNPTGDLPSAEAEVLELQALIASALERLKGNYTLETSLRTMLGSQASKKEVLIDLLLNDSTPWDVIHFAGHGTFGDNRPASSALRLYDGELKAFEVEEMKPRPIFFANACHSGISARETALAHGLLKGLAPAFLKGGAIGYIGTLWPVSDKPAREFATLFYSSLIDGDSIGQAIRVARSAVHSNYPNDLTALAYVLFGDPRRRLALYEPELTAGPYINERGLLQVFEIEREHPRLELLLVNDLPWILWRENDFVTWADRMSVSETSRRNMLRTLFEYRQFFRALVRSGSKVFRGIVNLKTLRGYLKSNPAETLDELMRDIADFGRLPNFELLVYEGPEDELEEIELVSKSDDILADPTHSVYVFNKQTRFERTVSYYLFAEFNAAMIREYAQRFHAYRDIAITQYRQRATSLGVTLSDAPDPVMLNDVTVRVLSHEIENVLRVSRD